MGGCVLGWWCMMHIMLTYVQAWIWQQKSIVFFTNTIHPTRKCTPESRCCWVRANHGIKWSYYGSTGLGILFFQLYVSLITSCISFYWFLNWTATVLGFKISMPIMIAPTAMQKMVHPEGMQCDLLKATPTFFFSLSAALTK